ncbi:MAG: hypothetical protein KAT70_05165 [Thermoplasmata archaeon]|nr:hypothetical protein [Thermoplasmata archaeon]
MKRSIPLPYFIVDVLEFYEGKIEEISDKILAEATETLFDREVWSMIPRDMFWPEDYMMKDIGMTQRTIEVSVEFMERVDKLFSKYDHSQERILWGLFVHPYIETDDEIDITRYVFPSWDHWKDIEIYDTAVIYAFWSHVFRYQDPPGWMEVKYCAD